MYLGLSGGDAGACAEVDRSGLGGSSGLRYPTPDFRLGVLARRGKSFGVRRLQSPVDALPVRSARLIPHGLG